MRRPALTMAVLLTVGRALGAARCWRLVDAAWFDLGDDRRMTIRADDADRYRLELWHGRHRAGTVWATAGDWLRLAECAEELAGERQRPAETTG